MTITPAHTLVEARQDILSGGSAMNTRRFLVIHFTSGASARSSVEFWKSPEAKGACAHIIIDRDGSIIQCRPFNRTAGHAGVSKWHGFEGLNSCSIGIELANAGDNSGLFAKWAVNGHVMLRHKSGGPVTGWEVYPQAQIDALTTLSQALVKRYNLDDVVGHDDIAPDRKNDPGPAFPMQRLREACGFKGMPKP